jgi:hypothetical protein
MISLSQVDQIHKILIDQFGGSVVSPPIKKTATQSNKAAVFHYRVSLYRN